MKKILRRALLVILAVSLAACSTFSHVADYSVVANTPSSVAAAADISDDRLAPGVEREVWAGDDLELQLISGEKVFLKLDSIEPDALVGTGMLGGSVRVPTNKIEIIKRAADRRPAGGPGDGLWALLFFQIMFALSLSF